MIRPSGAVRLQTQRPFSFTRPERLSPSGYFRPGRNTTSDALSPKPGVKLRQGLSAKGRLLSLNGCLFFLALPGLPAFWQDKRKLSPCPDRTFRNKLRNNPTITAEYRPLPAHQGHLVRRSCSAHRAATPRKPSRCLYWPRNHSTLCPCVTPANALCPSRRYRA